MTILKYKADRVPVTIFFALTVLDFVVYFAVDRLWIILAYWAAMVPVKAIVSAWNHHHQHVPMFRSKPLNRILEMSFALHTGATTNAWVLHHVHGHHKNYLDQELDESRWRRRSGETYGYIHYTAITALTSYQRAYTVGRNHPRLQRAFVGYGILTFALVASLVAYKPISGLFLFAIPMVTSLIITIAATYHHHTGLDTDDHMQASHNYTHRIRNILTGNLGYHTAHHYRQGVHWSKLPELHETLVEKIPAEYIRTSSTNGRKLGVSRSKVGAS